MSQRQENDSRYLTWNNRVLRSFITENNGEFASTVFAHPNIACNGLRSNLSRRELHSAITEKGQRQVDSKTSRFVGCSGSCCLNSVVLLLLPERHSIGELTVLDSTMALCSPAFAMASSRVRPRPPVPPATATTTIVKVRKKKRNLVVDGCSSMARKIPNLDDT